MTKSINSRSHKKTSRSRFQASSNNVNSSSSSYSSGSFSSTPPHKFDRAEIWSKSWKAILIHVAIEMAREDVSNFSYQFTFMLIYRSKASYRPLARVDTLIVRNLERLRVLTHSSHTESFLILGSDTEHFDD